MNKTKIPYADFTWNVVSGCLTRCPYCFAKRISDRFGNHPNEEELKKDPRNAFMFPGENLRVAMMKPSVPFPFGFLPTFYPDRLEEPMKVKKPSRIFVADMGDLWGKWIPKEWIEAVLEVVRKCHWHTFLFLTKYPQRYQEFEIPDNCWIGTTVEDNSKLHRIGELLQANASLYWVSHEPAMGELDITPYLPCQRCGGTGLEPEGSPYWYPGYTCRECDGPPYVGWFVTGAMSGPNAVPMDEDWIRHERDACVECGVPFFYKQRIVNGKKVEMPELDGKVWGEYPKVENGGVITG